MVSLAASGTRKLYLALFIDVPVIVLAAVLLRAWLASL